VEFKPISEIVDRSKVLMVRLEDPPTQELKDAVANLPGVVSVKIGEQDPRLHISVSSSLDDSEIDLSILGLLKEKGVSYREIRRGESLEDKVVEITRSNSW
jgi:hypothetical protein